MTTKFKIYQDRDSISETTWNSIKDAFNSKVVKKAGDVFTTGEINCYIDSNVKFSRKEFKENFPNVKIVRDVSKANVVIINEAFIPSIWFGSNKSYQFGTRRWDTNAPEVNKVIEVANVDDIIIVNEKTVKFKAGELKEFTEENIASIGSMLKSPDKEVFDLGLTLLFQYDHVKNVDTFYLLMAKANNMSWYKRKRSRLTEPKIQWIKAQFKNHKF